MTRELAVRVGFSSEDSDAIRHGVEEACTYILSRAFEENERGEIQIIIELESRGMRIRLKDQGLPFDRDLLEKRLDQGSTLPRHLGVKLLRATMDEVSFRCLGREGNEITLFRNLKGQLPPVALEEFQKRESPTISETHQIRRAEADDAMGISRCIYRSYGYTYTGAENVYSPEWLSQMNAEQSMISMITVTDHGEVIGHVALMRMEGSHSAFELGQAAVDPRYRSRGLLKSMMSNLIQQAPELGVQIVYGEPVTSHTHSQKAVKEFDFVEVGLLLASVGEQVQFRGSKDRHRLSLLPSIKRLSTSTTPIVFPPVRYAEFILETLRRSGSVAEIDTMEVPTHPMPSVVSWGVHSLSGTGFIKVERAGADVVDVVRRAFRHLLAELVTSVHLDIELTDPRTPGLWENVREIGFFYGAVLPGIGHNVTLRLQYLNQEMVPLEALHLLTDWSKQIAELVLKDRDSIVP